MAEDKKGFLLYADQKELFEQLPDDKAGQLIKHIFKYVNDENPITEDLVIKLSFIPIKQQFKRDLEKWDKTREVRSKAGKASAEAKKLKKQQDATKSTHVKSVKENSTKSTVSVNDNVNVTVNGNVNDINKKKEKFNFRKELLNYGFDSDLVDDWLIVRKTKKATNTKTAFNGFINELEKQTCDIDSILKTCIEKSWSGFKHEWINNLNKQNGQQNNKTEQEQRHDTLDSFING